MQKRAKKVIKLAILGEICEETLERFMYGTSREADDGFLLNNREGVCFEIVLSSAGGDIDVGVSIYEMLRTSAAEVSITGYGIVGSIAALIFMAGQERILTPATRFFVHPGTMMAQNPENLFALAAKVDEVKGLHIWYCDELAARSGYDVVKMFRLCDKESFFSARQALEMGIATKVSLYTDR